MSAAASAKDSSVGADRKLRPIELPGGCAPLNGLIRLRGRRAPPDPSRDAGPDPGP